MRVNLLKTPQREPTLPAAFFILLMIYDSTLRNIYSLSNTIINPQQNNILEQNSVIWHQFVQGWILSVRCSCAMTPLLPVGKGGIIWLLPYCFLKKFTNHKRLDEFIIIGIDRLRRIEGLFEGPGADHALEHCVVVKQHIGDIVEFLILQFRLILTNFTCVAV